MNIFIAIVLWLAAIAAAGWVFRFVGQKVTGNKPLFRDMSYGVAVGYILAAVVLVWLGWSYVLSRSPDQTIANKYFFLGKAVEGFLLFAAAAWAFRIFGRNVGSAGTRKLFRSMPLTASFGILTIIIYAVVAIFAGVIAPYGQEEILGAANVVPGGNPAMGGNPDYPLGTDQIGRDILSRLIYGAQNTVGIAFATTVLAFLIGATLGFLAATLGGWLDQLLSRAVDVLMAIPSLIFALLLMTIASAWAGSEKGLLTFYMVVIIAVIDSTRVFRLARAVGLNIVVMDYIEAAKLRGEGMGYLIFREILPNATAPLLAEFGLRFCFVFLTIASLSFLGVGIQPPLADWGTMVRDLAQFINFAAFAPQVASAPLLAASAIALLTVAVNFVVDWMLHKSSGLKE
ncbi:ABC transporter permease [Shimia thalassica]|jgi:peptide/nickel transport system permease protein|uniref:ABC transporter permease n=1 Tax=Shimia thalassica TaxID=1715693 RepID=UPI000C08A05D|nr:ABC transporter permease [Shimia thalassica]PHO05538.1 ABC transporter permease [Rhodobacteraceae bacterium 4F10]MDO6481193.1 ABC transporter permease [Shimia thalassica]MDO6523430.1 ABC transporter permease [Shimia thalassica]MDO6799802.1 ABC transporter permease [Shimia thalassica]MDP2494415.1 ABC transporter permease [Shimia thalassica]